MFEKIEPKLFFQIILLNALIILGAIFINVSTGNISAFTEPPTGTVPPANNTLGPITITNEQQSKEGAFFVNNEWRAKKFVDGDNINFFFAPSDSESLKVFGNIEMNQSGFISDSIWPSDPQDLATKAYVDAAAAAQGW